MLRYLFLFFLFLWMPFHQANAISDIQLPTFQVKSNSIEFDRVFFEDEDDLFFVEGILRDSIGFMWFAAKEGLFRFDGNQIIRIGIRQNEPGPYTRETLLAFIEHQNQIWMALPNDICVIDTRTLESTCFATPLHMEPAIGNSYRGAIHLDNNGMVYAGYWNGGMVTFDPLTGLMQHFYSHEENDQIPFKSNTITDIKTLNDSTLLIASHDGLYVFDKNHAQFDKFLSINEPDRDGSNQFNCILFSRMGYHWFGTNNGLLRVDHHTGEQKRFYFDQAPITEFERNIVEAIDESSDGMLWIGTRYGLYRMNPFTEEFEAFYHEKNNQQSIHRNYIRSVYTDKFNHVWIGHHSGAISYLSNRKKSFTSYQVISDYVAEQRIHSLYSEKDRIWFGSETGLFVYNRTKKELNHYTNKPGNPHSLSHNFVSGILEYQEGKFLISTDKGGINKFDPGTGQFENIIKGSQNLASYSQSDIWSIYLDNTGMVWCGTGGDGLLGIHTISGEIVRYRHDPTQPYSLSSNFVGPVVRGQNGVVWVGTAGKGLDYFSPGSGRIENINTRSGDSRSLSSDRLSSLCLTNDNKLLIGTFAGVDILDMQTGIVTPFHFNNRLPSRMVQSIVQDKTGNIWIATRRGLMKYEPFAQSYQIFCKSDGLCSNDFIPGSFFHAPNGEIFFGTQNGFISFFPWDIEKNQNPPPIAITDIRVFNSSLTFNPADTIDYLNEKLILPYHQNNLGFQFSSLDYNDPDKNQVRYKLEGFDTDWSDNAQNGMASYNNLSPGTYTFRVIGSNNDNVWNMEGAAVQVIIRPPFWDTILFKSILFTGILSAIFLFIYLQISKVSRQKKALERLVTLRTAELQEQKNHIERKNTFLQEQKNAIEHQAFMLAESNKKLEDQKVAIEKQAEELKEMDRIKSRFFASISHEFRTPLTLILNAQNMLQKAKNDKTDDSSKELKLSIIQNNVLRLQRLIDQLLDLVKIESGFMKLSVNKGNIREFIMNITRLFAVNAEARKIHFHTEFEIEQDMGYIDWDKLDKILFNLLSNALKYTRQHGSVKVSVTEDSNANHHRLLKIDITDTGCGISRDEQVKVFSMFYQVVQNNQNGTGIGLALAKQLALVHKGDILLESKPEKGCRFTVTIPISREAFDDHEIMADDQARSSNIRHVAETTKDLSLIQITGNSAHDRPKVLFVDDNQDLCLLMQMQLNEFFNVEVAYDAIQGLEKSIHLFPDIIVSDLMMPGISGIEFCRRIKDDIRTEHLPFILLTARSDEQSQIEAFSSYADDYITKPFSVDVLLLKLKNQLEMRKKIEEKLRKEINNTTHAVVHKNYSNRFLNEAVQIITRHMEETDFTVDDLASGLNMSRTQLYRKSEKLLGMSANNFIKKVKLNNAFELLKDGGYNISEVAYKTGFKTPGYFSRCFENQFGMLPSKFLANSFK